GSMLKPADVALVEANGVLMTILNSELPDNGWHFVEQTVTALISAVDRGDADSIDAAIDDLRLGRVVTRIEDVPRRSIPEPIRERISELLNTIAGLNGQDARVEPFSEPERHAH